MLGVSDQGCGLKRLARRWRCPAEFGAHPKSLTSLNAQLIESNLQENVEQGLTMAGEFNRAAEAFLDRGFALLSPAPQSPVPQTTSRRTARAEGQAGGFTVRVGVSRCVARCPSDKP